MGVTICYICADERVDELRSEGRVGLGDYTDFTAIGVNIAAARARRVLETVPSSVDWPSERKYKYSPSLHRQLTKTYSRAVCSRRKSLRR